MLTGLREIATAAPLARYFNNYGLVTPVDSDGIGLHPPEGVSFVVESDGKLLGQIYGSERTPRGRAMFIEAFSAVRSQVKYIETAWREDSGLTDNLDAFNIAVRQGMTPHDAVWATFTGKMARELGFGEPTIVDIEGEPGDATSVVIQFRPPTGGPQSSVAAPYVEVEPGPPNRSDTDTEAVAEMAHLISTRDRARRTVEARVWTALNTLPRTGTDSTETFETTVENLLRAPLPTLRELRAQGLSDKWIARLLHARDSHWRIDQEIVRRVPRASTATTHPDVGLGGTNDTPESGAGSRPIANEGAAERAMTVDSAQWSAAPEIQASRRDQTANMAAGRDLTAELDYGELAEAMRRSTQDGGDQALLMICQKKGFGGVPTVVAPSRLSDYVTPGRPLLHRGFGDIVQAQTFLTGPGRASAGDPLRSGHSWLFGHDLCE